MLKSGTWLLASLLISPLACSTTHGQEPAADASVSAETSAAVDTISPVPAPEIPLGSNAGEQLVMPKSLNIENSGGSISGDIESGIRFGGPVKITGDNGLEIFANTAILDTRAKTVTLEGDISIYQGDTLQRGDEAVYHYAAKRLESTGLRASIDPILLESGKFTSSREGDRQVFIGKDAGITTHDVENPNYWLRARETRIYPGEKVVFKNLLAYAGDTPVFWFPYLAQPLDAELGYHFLPGSKSAWGPYLLNTYGIMLGGERDPLTGESTDAWLLSRWHFDMRARRGLGTGVDLADTRAVRNNSITGLGLYYMHDQDPGYSRSGVVRQFDSPDRYKLQLKHRTLLDITDNAEWRIDANLNYLSDEYYLEDLEEDRYRRNPAPDNTVGIYRRSDTTLLSMLTRYQVNDFYRADSRLPEISFDIVRQPLFDLPLLHEGSISLGLLGERAADPDKIGLIDPLSQLTLGDPGTAALLDELSGFERTLAEAMVAAPLGSQEREQLRKQLVDSRYARFRFYEQVSMPMMIGDVLSFTPQVGFGHTRYAAVDGPGEGFSRNHFHVGAETSLKFSRDLGDYRNHELGINGLMHVMEPYANWSVVSTDDYRFGDPGVDRLSPTTRPRPLDPVRFTAVDQMQSWDILRVGTRNRLITRRDNQSFEWLYLDTYMDAFMNDPEGERNTSNLYNDARWQPVPWMSVDLETQFPIANGGSGYSEFTSRTRFMPSDFFEFSLGYRWLDGHPFLSDSSRVDFRTYSHLTPNWGIGTRHSVEMDDGVLEYQQYTLHRDLGQWVAGVGMTVRDNRLKEEYGVIFTLTLKDFPSVALPFEYDAE